MNFIGILYLILTFLFCFCAVHVFKLAYVGFLSFYKKQEEPTPEPKKEKKEKKPEPVYYIVEKKRARKSTYSEPKEITFK